eukprot:m.397979 g.397979  ORF g.397979 m.397979 type:complete len:109 (-) comp20108_c2_seq3:113-439(-)
MCDQPMCDGGHNTRQHPRKTLNMTHTTTMAEEAQPSKLVARGFPSSTSLSHPGMATGADMCHHRPAHSALEHARGLPSCQGNNQHHKVVLGPKPDVCRAQLTMSAEIS